MCVSEVDFEIEAGAGASLLPLRVPLPDGLPLQGLLALLSRVAEQA